MNITGEAQEHYNSLRFDNSRFPYQKRFRNKGHLNLATEVLKDFRPGVFNSP